MNLFTPNTVRIKNFYAKSEFTLVWRLCMLFSFVFTTLSLTFIAISVKEVIIYCFCSFISISSLIRLKRTNKFEIIYFFSSIIGTLIVVYTLNLFTDHVHHGDFSWLMLTIVFSFFGLELIDKLTSQLNFKIISYNSVNQYSFHLKDLN